MSIYETDSGKLKHVLDELKTLNVTEMLALLPYMPDQIIKAVKTSIIDTYSYLLAEGSKKSTLATKFGRFFRPQLFLFPTIIQYMKSDAGIHIDHNHFDFTPLEANYILGFMSRAIHNYRQDDLVGDFFVKILKLFNKDQLNLTMSEIEHLMFPGKSTQPLNVPPPNSLEQLWGRSELLEESTHLKTSTRTVGQNIQNRVQEHEPAVVGKKQRGGKKAAAVVVLNKIQPEINPPKPAPEPRPRTSLQKELLTDAHFYQRVYQLLSGTLVYLQLEEIEDNENKQQRQETRRRYEGMIKSINLPQEILQSELANMNQQAYYKSMVIMLQCSQDVWSTAQIWNIPYQSILCLYRTVVYSVWQPNASAGAQIWDDQSVLNTALTAACLLAIRLRSMLIVCSTSNKTVPDQTQRLCWTETEPVCQHCNQPNTSVRELYISRKLMFCQECGLPRYCRTAELRGKPDRAFLKLPVVMEILSHLRRWVDTHEEPHPRRHAEMKMLHNFAQMILEV